MKAHYFGLFKRILSVSILSLFGGTVLAQSPWTVVPSNFQFSGQVEAVVVMDGSEVTNGYLGAFVGDECRGVVEAVLFPPTGLHVFSFLVYSNASAGEFLSFRYYDDVNDEVHPISETKEFVSDMVASAMTPDVLHVVSNNAPVANCVDQSTLDPSAGPIVFDLCTIFSDPDGDALTYDASGSAGTSLSWLNSCELEFTAATSGISTLTFSASDGELEAECSYSFNINPANNPPVRDIPIGMIQLDEGYGSHVIDLDAVFSDPDGDDLTYTVDVANEGIVTASVSGAQLTLTEVVPGNTSFTITASDGEFSVQDVATIVVLAAVAQPPWNVTPASFEYSGEIDAVVLVNGVEVNTGVLGVFVGNECRGVAGGAYFAPTGKTVFSLLAYSNTSSGDILTFRYYDPVNLTVQSVEEVIPFSANMQIGSASAPQELNITSANNLPVLSQPLSDQVVEEHFGTIQLEVGNVFTDPDSDPLTYSASIDNEQVATVALNGSTLTVTETGTGVTFVELFASDGEFSTMDRFFLTVTEVNDPPVVVSSIADQSLLEGFATKNIAISGTFSDPEGDVLSYTSSSSDESVVTVKIEGGNLVLTEAGIGTATVSLCVNDGEFEVCDPFSVTVEDVNESPVADCAGLTDLEAEEGFGIYDISNVCAVFSDPDGDALTYSITSSNTDVATVAIDACAITLTEAGLGTTTIELCASDGEFEVCCDFILNIVPGNDSPEIVVALDDQTLDEGFGSASISISGTFSDPDEDALTYTAVSSDPGVVTVALDGTTLDITEAGMGTATVTVCASDGEFEVCDEFQVVVTGGVNESPVADCSLLRDTVLLEGFGSYTLDDICGGFSDPDGDQLTYSVESDNTAVATASIDACVITVTEAGTGTAVIDLCASDGELQVCCSITVQIAAENELTLFLDDEQLQENDSVKYCSDAHTLTLTVNSDVPWTITSSGDWFTADQQDASHVSIVFTENTTGESRSGSIAVRDTQDHVINLVVYQSATCIPDAVPLDEAAGFRIFPNPVRAQLNIELPEAWNTQGEVALKLFAADGRLLKTLEAISAAEHSIMFDMRPYDDGIYYLVIEKSDRSVLQIPVVKQR